MFIGGLYTHQDSSMAVVVPIQQAKIGKVERVTSSSVKVGGVSVLINGAVSQEKEDKIVIRR